MAKVLINPLEYHPENELRYIPHEISPNLLWVGDLPERLWNLSIKDKSSQLWDQASWLWATTEYSWLAHHFAGTAFTDNPIVGGGIIEKRTEHVSRGLSNVLVKNIEAMHLKDGVLASEWTPKKGTGDVLSMQDAALGIVGLREYKDRHEMLDIDEALREKAETMITATTDFLLKLQGPNGGFYEKYKLSTGEGIGEKAVSAPQWWGIRALVSAYHATGEESYATAARRTYNYLNKNFWHEESGLYRNRIGDDTITLTPLNAAATMGAMRELMIATPLHLVRPHIDRFTRWFVQAIDTSGLTMSEDNRTGELGLGQENPDEDGDGIPFLKYGHGRYGVAPLAAGKVAVNIGGPDNRFFGKLKGDRHMPDRFNTVQYAYVPKFLEEQKAVLFAEVEPKGGQLLASVVPIALESSETSVDEELIEREWMERFSGLTIPLPASRPIERGSDLSGKEIFNKNCSVCHGPDGRGITGKDLIDIAQKPREEIFKVPKFGRFEKGMPTWGEGVDELSGVLTDEEIWHAVDYIKNELFKDVQGNTQ